MPTDISLPTVSRTFPLILRRTGRTRNAVATNAANLARVPKYYQGYEPPVMRESALLLPRTALIVDSYGIIQSFLKVSPTTNPWEIELKSVHSGPWNISPQSQFFKDAEIVPPTINEMRFMHAVRGAGRALIAFVTEWALDNLPIRGDNVPFILVSPKWYSDEFYEKLGFQWDQRTRRNMYLDRDSAREFLLNYRENPFFF